MHHVLIGPFYSSSSMAQTRAQTRAKSQAPSSVSSVGFAGSVRQLPVLRNRKAKSAPEQVMDLEDGVLEKMEKFVHQVEEKLEKLEKVSADFIDVKYLAMASQLSGLKSDLIGRTRIAGENFCAALESHMEEIEDAQASLSARWLRGVEFYERTLSAMEASHIEASLQRAKDRLLDREEMPIPWQNNPYIIRGYKFCHNYADCVRSAFQIHNETCNIWTHVIALVIMLVLAFYHLPTTEEWAATSWKDAWPVAIFLGAAVKCLCCSVIWHVFCNIKHLHVHVRMACVDYSGIMLLITASILTVEYAALYCHPKTQAFYLAVTSLSGLAGVAFTWHPNFDKFVMLRVAFFVSFALAGAFAGIHAMFYEGFWAVFRLHVPVFKSLLAYGLGVVVYATRTPERFFHGKFDYVGMSHNLWHLAVFAGIYYHYEACIHLLRHGVSASCR